jgi:hypothetical protein
LVCASFAAWRAIANAIAAATLASITVTIIATARGRVKPLGDTSRTVKGGFSVATR